MKNDKKCILKLFSEFVRLQSVSADTSRHDHVKKAAHFLSDKLKSIGFKATLLTKFGNPVVYARYDTKEQRENPKTIFVYGHYDVQPEDPISEWGSDPFTLTLSNGKMFGRGTADNKGHIVQNIAAAAQLISERTLQNNIIFFFEGEEEIGSSNFEKYVNSVKSDLDEIDVFIITDTGMYKRNVPQIYYGLRGLAYFELRITTGSRDVHSGTYGNKVLNPALIASDLMSKMKNVHTNEVAIPHFYDDVRNIPRNELTMLITQEKSIEDELHEAGVSKLLTTRGSSPYLGSKIHPSLDINGMHSGYQGEGAKTIIPNTITVKFSCRLVEFQDPEKIVKLVQDFISNNKVAGAEYELSVLSCDHPFYTNITNDYSMKIAGILQNVFRNKTLFNRSGGTIPAAEILQRVTDKPVILTGFTLPDDNMHAPNENFDEEMFWKGIDALKAIYSEI